MPASIPKSERCLHYFVRIEFGGRGKLRSIRSTRKSSEGFSLCTEEVHLARKTVLVCDNCGSEIQEGKGAMMRLNFTDARRGSKQADLCDNCAGQLPGQAVARRGRRPKSAVAA
jgi:hypothetical protein